MSEKKLTALIVFGTRPEAIKMAPVIHALADDTRFKYKLCITSQHKEMLNQVLELFKIKPDFDLKIMKSGQSLNDVTSAIITSLKPIIQSVKPDIMLVHGDTTTTLAASLAGFYEKIPIGHVEAGLRTGDINSPWPEEANRKLTSVIAKYHFTPSEISKRNLIGENIKESNIKLTGNTVIDALFWVKKNYIECLSSEDFSNKFPFIDTNKRFILVTAHRRENFGDGLGRICKSLITITKKYSDIQIVYSLHLNPSVKKPVKHYLSGINNIFLIDPQPYVDFCYLMNKSWVIMTDSGGIQEEAPSLGKPVLVLRDNSERPEAVSAGTVKLVGTDEKTIISYVTQLVSSPKLYDSMAEAKNPYGDGSASKRILNFIIDKFKQ